MNIVSQFKNLDPQNKRYISIGLVLALLVALPLAVRAIQTGTYDLRNRAQENPTNACGGTCGSNYNCNSELFCYNGYCRNPFCKEEANCVCPTTTPISTSTATPTASPTVKPTLSPSPSPTPSATLSPTPSSSPSSSPILFVTPTPSPPPESKKDSNIIFLIIGIAALALALGLTIFRKKTPKTPTSIPANQNYPSQKPQEPEIKTENPINQPEKPNGPPLENTNPETPPGYPPNNNNDNPENIN